MSDVAFSPPAADVAAASAPSKPSFQPPAADMLAATKSEPVGTSGEAFTPPSTDAAASAIVDRINTSTSQQLADDHTFDSAATVAQLHTALNPEQISKLAKADYLQRKQGITMGDIGRGIAKTPGAVKDFVVGLKDLAERIPAVVGQAGYNVGGGSTAEAAASPDEALREQAKKSSEAIAGLESGVTSFGHMIQNIWNLGGAKLAARAIGVEPEKISPPKEYDEERETKNLFDRAGYIQQQNLVSQGKGEVAKAVAIDADTLAKEGVQLDPEVIERLSSVESPVNWIPILAGAKIAQAANGTFQVLNKAGIPIATKLTRAAAEKTVAGIGRMVEAGGKLIGKAGGTVGLGEMLSHGGGLEGIATGLAAKAGTTVASKVIQGAGRALQNQAVTKPLLDFAGSAAKGAAGGTAFGAAMNLGAETPEEKASNLTTGAAFGALGGVLHEGGSKVNQAALKTAQHIVAAHFDTAPDVQPVADYSLPNADPELEQLHEDGLEKLKELSPLAANLLNRYRAALAVSGIHSYLITEEQARKINPALADKEGVANIVLPTGDGKMAKGILWVVGDKGAPALGHEVGHFIDRYILTPEEKAAMDKVTAGKWQEGFNEHYKSAEGLTQEQRDSLTPEQLQSELRAEILSNVLNKGDISNIPAGITKTALGVASNVLERLGLYQPGVAPGISAPNVTGFGTKLSPIANEIAKKAVSNWLNDPTVTPPAPAVEPEVNPTPTPQPPKAEEIKPAPAPTPAPAPAPATEEIKPVPAPAPEVKTEAPNIRVTREQQNQFNETPERTDIGIEEANAALEKASPEQKQIFQTLRESLRTPQGQVRPVEIVHSGVKPEEAGTGVRTKRRGEQEAQAERTEFQKLIIPNGFNVTNDGKVQLRAFSPDKVVANAHQIVESAAKKDVSNLIPYENKDGKLTANGEASLREDLLTYLSNQAKGFKGTGEPLVRPEGHEGFIPPETGKAEPLDPKKVEFLNLIQAIAPPKTARVNTIKGVPIKPVNVRAYELAKANNKEVTKPGVISNKDIGKQQYGPEYNNQSIVEPNLLRKKLDEAGVPTRELIEATERINLEDIKQANPRPESRLRAPVTDVTAAGFLPKRVAELSPEDFKAEMDANKDNIRKAGIKYGLKLADDAARGVDISAERAEIKSLATASAAKAKELMKAKDLAGVSIEGTRAAWLREVGEAIDNPARYKALEEKLQFQPVTNKAEKTAPNEDVKRIAADYAREAGIDYTPHTGNAPINEPLAKRIANFYEAAPHEPTNPEVKASYDAFARETKAQYHHLESEGYKMEPWKGEGQPYKNSKEMAADVRDNKHLYYFKTEGGYGEGKEVANHPMLEKSGIKVDGKDIPINDVFRAVHDIMGHAPEGYEFGPRGELNAFLSHAALYSDKARPAMAAETLGQNSWVNFGKHLRDEAGNIPKKGEKGHIPLTERPFAEQKATTLPRGMVEAVRNPREAEMQFAPSNEPRAIKQAAIKADDGKIFEGPMHMFAHMEAAKANHEGPFTDGFITNDGEFLDREQAFKRAVEMKQYRSLRGEQELESGSFAAQQRRAEAGYDKGTDPLSQQFLPTKNPRAIKNSAVRDTDGEIFEGKTHEAAYRKAEDADRSRVGMEEGFVTQSGEFLGRKASYKRALDEGQIPDYEAELRKHGHSPELEALSLAHYRKKENWPQARPKLHLDREEEVDGIRNYFLRDQEGNAVAELTTSKETPTVAWIDNVRVDTALQKQGLAESLYREAVKDLRKDGVKTLRGNPMHPAVEKIRQKLFGGSKKAEGGDAGPKTYESSLEESNFLPARRKAKAEELDEFGRPPGYWDKYNRPETAKEALAPKLWMYPNEEVHETGSGFHEQYLAENADELNKRFGTDFSDEVNVYDRLKALNKGFVRMAYEANGGRLNIEANADKFTKGKRDKILEFVADNLEHFDKIHVGLLDKNGRTVKERTQSLLNMPESEKLDHIPFVTDNGAQFQPVARKEVTGAPEISEFNDEDSIKSALGKPGWSIFSATQESIGPHTHEKNLLANRELEDELKRSGYDFTEAQGYYKGVDQGKNFVVTNITPQEALDLGREYGQESVLVPEGLLYNDGTINPVKPEETVVGPKAEKADFYSQVKNGPAFTMGFDSGVREPFLPDYLPKRAAGEPPVDNYDRSKLNAMTTAEKKAYFPEAIVGEKGHVKSEIVGSPRYENAVNEWEAQKEGWDKHRAAVESFGDELVKKYNETKHLPEVQEGANWYSDVAPAFQKFFGKDAPLFAELVAATSPRNSPKRNWDMAMEAYKLYKAGWFDDAIKKFEEGLTRTKDGSMLPMYEKAVPLAERPKKVTSATLMNWWIAEHNLKPTKAPKMEKGKIVHKLYSMHSDAVLQVFARRWLEKNGGPKTLNFVQNLVGSGHGATIDLWADRTLREAGYKGYVDRWRILPENVKGGISDKDFAFGQEVFKNAADKLGMLPDALQGALWFAEKLLWAEKGWAPLDLGTYKPEVEKLSENPPEAQIAKLPKTRAEAVKNLEIQLAKKPKQGKLF